MTAKLVIFDHIDKSGGSTFKKILHQEFQDKYLGIGSYASFVKIPPRLEGQWCFAGHFAAGGPYLLEQRPECHIVTFLRDPLSRFVSLYNYLKYTYYMKSDIVSFLCTEFFNNTYTYWFGQGSLEKAIEKLSQPHISFGLTKYFDKSLQYFSQRLGRNLPFVAQHNVNTLAKDT